MAYEVALDETLKVDSPDLVEGALLQRLEEHQADLDAFLQELNAARKSETSNRLALQQLLKTAAQLQAKLGLSSEISGAVAAALEKVGIPVQPLQEAKALLLALSRLDAAMDAKEAAPSKLKKVLDSWEELRRMEDVCKEEGKHGAGPAASPSPGHGEYDGVPGGVLRAFETSTERSEGTALRPLELA